MKKFFWLFLCFLIISIFLLVSIKNKKNSSPKPLLQVKPISYIVHGSRQYPKIALTFDADMTPFMADELKTGKIKSFYNQKIVEILEKKNIPATIFVTGLWAENYPEVLQKLAQNPLFEVENHSYSHPGFTPKCFTLPPMPAWGREEEFIKSQKAIENISGIKPKFFRFPGGCHSENDIKLANGYGFTVVGWDAASSDSFNNNLSAIIKNIEAKTQNGSILLFHFNGGKNAPKTSEALEIIIPVLKQKGFEFVKLSDLPTD